MYIKFLKIYLNLSAFVRDDGIKSVKSKLGKIVIKLYSSENLLKK